MFDTFMQKRRIRQIADLLETERRLILQGPLVDLKSVSEKCEKLVTDLQDCGGGFSADDFAKLKKAATENQRLLKASIQGVKQAQEQLAKQREELSKIGTYTSSGQRDEVCVPKDASDRRA